MEFSLIALAAALRLVAADAATVPASIHDNGPYYGETFHPRNVLSPIWYGGSHDGRQTWLTRGGENSWFTLKLDAPTAVAGFRLLNTCNVPYNDRSTTCYRVYGSPDNSQWTEIKSGTLASCQNIQGTPLAIDADTVMSGVEYVKFETCGWNGAGGGLNYFAVVAGAASHSGSKVVYQLGVDQSDNVNGMLTGLIPHATYTISVEVLRNDLASGGERVNSIVVGGTNMGGCNPDGGDYDCTFFQCPLTPIEVTASASGTVPIAMDYQGHSWDCDCDASSWVCSREGSVADRTQVTAVARFTYTSVGTLPDSSPPPASCTYQPRNDWAFAGTIDTCVSNVAYTPYRYSDQGPTEFHGGGGDVGCLQFTLADQASVEIRYGRESAWNANCPVSIYTGFTRFSNTVVSGTVIDTIDASAPGEFLKTFTSSTLAAGTIVAICEGPDNSICGVHVDQITIGSGTAAQTSEPTSAPTSAPTLHPTPTPTDSPSKSPTQAPTAAPTLGPTGSPTSSPTSSPTQAGPWDLDHVDMSADFTNASTVTLEYIAGVGRTYRIDLFEKDCATPVNTTLYSTSDVTTPISGNTTHHTVTITHSFDIGALASSDIWDPTSEKLQVCQKISLILGNMDIVDDVREIDVDFDLEVDFNTTVTLEGGVTENVTDRVAFDDVRAYQCNGEFVENDAPLAPNQELVVCIETGDEAVIVADLIDMEINQDDPSVRVGVVANRAPIVQAITSVSVKTGGLVAETRVPIDRFSFETGKNITVSGKVELAFAGTSGTRKLRALQVVGEDIEEAGYTVTVNLKSEGGAAGEGQAQAPIGVSDGYAIMGKGLGGPGLVVLAVIGLVM